MARTYISCADTAKLVRQALKESFPGIKFGVRSSTYSGGASIYIRWTDGPNAAMVESIAGKFSGSYRNLRDKVVSLLPSTQTPNYYCVGAASPTYEAQKPFTI